MSFFSKIKKAVSKAGKFVGKEAKKVKNFTEDATKIAINMAASPVTTWKGHDVFNTNKFHDKKLGKISHKVGRITGKVVDAAALVAGTIVTAGALAGADAAILGAAGAAGEAAAVGGEAAAIGGAAAAAEGGIAASTLAEGGGGLFAAFGKKIASKVKDVVVSKAKDKLKQKANDLIAGALTKKQSPGTSEAIAQKVQETGMTAPGATTSTAGMPMILGAIMLLAILGSMMGKKK